MRLVHEVSPGVVELNWVWLPTWLGQNTYLKKEIEDHVHSWLAEQGEFALNESNLDLLNEVVLNFLRRKFPKEPVGLIEFLKGLEHVQYGAEG